MRSIAIATNLDSHELIITLCEETRNDRYNFPILDSLLPHVVMESDLNERLCGVWVYGSFIRSVDLTWYGRSLTRRVFKSPVINAISL